MHIHGLRVLGALSGAPGRPGRDRLTEAESSAPRAIVRSIFERLFARMTWRRSGDVA